MLSRRPHLPAEYGGLTPVDEGFDDRLFGNVAAHNMIAQGDKDKVVDCWEQSWGNWSTNVQHGTVAMFGCSQAAQDKIDEARRGAMPQ